MLKNFATSLIALFTLVILITPVQVAAVDAFGNVPCSEARNSAVCKDKGRSGNPISGNGSLLVNIARIVAYVGGIAAIIMIIISGIRYILSGGDPGKISSAKDTLVNSLIGIAVIVLGTTLIVYVVKMVS